MITDWKMLLGITARRWNCVKNAMSKFMLRMSTVSRSVPMPAGAKTAPSIKAEGTSEENGWLGRLLRQVVAWELDSRDLIVKEVDRFLLGC